MQERRLHVICLNRSG